MSKMSLQEKLGVPENLIPTSVSFYDDVLKKMKLNLKKGKTEYKFEFYPTQTLKIGTHEIGSITLDVEITPLDDFDRVDFASMGFSSRTKYEKPNVRKIYSKLDDVVLNIHILVPEDYEVQDIIDWFVKDRTPIISSISHELMHAYDAEKKGFEKISDRSKYSAAQETKFGLEPLDNLAFNIYFTHLIENLVRPSEIMSYLETEKINKRDFLNFLKSNRTYQRLQDVKKWNLNDAMNEVENKHMSRVEKILDIVNEDMKGSTDREKVEFVFDLWVRNYIRNNMESFSNQMSSNFMEGLFGFPENKEKAIERHLNRLRKIKNPFDFIRNEETVTKTIADKVLRKIYKLYDLLPE